MKSLQKVLSVLLAGAMALTATACSGGGASSAAAPAASGASSAVAPASSAAASLDTVPTIDKINLGTDYKDIKADLTVWTNRTDIDKTIFVQYVKDFQKLYPGITIKFLDATDYDNVMTTHMASKNWGDLCSIPSTVKQTDFLKRFVPFGQVADLSKIYNFCGDAKASYNGVCYGIATTGNVEGIVYNKKVYKDAGITTLPKTPDEFINDLKLIKSKTQAVPLYTNFHADWPLGKWDIYKGLTATGDPDFTQLKLYKMKDPFSKTSFPAGTGPYAVYNILYEAVKQKLTEADPTTTDWESSKGKLNNGQIATMALGSWAVPQMQQAGPNKEDIGYMPFPISVNGQQYLLEDPDYVFGINKDSSKVNQIGAMLYVKWFTEKSNFAFDQGGVPIVKGSQLPPVLADCQSAKLMEDTPPTDSSGEAYTFVKRDSDLNLDSDTKHVQEVVESALKGTKTMDQIASEWNADWAKGQKENNITPEGK